MNSVVLDASFIVKLIVEEPGSMMCHRALQIYQSKGRSFIVPGHAGAEVLEVMRRKLRAGMVTEDQFLRAPLAIQRLAEDVPVGDLLERACSVATAHGVTIYDALYVALADREKALLLTSDLKLVARLSQTPFRDLALGVGEAGLVYHGDR